MESPLNIWEDFFLFFVVNSNFIYTFAYTLTIKKMKNIHVLKTDKPSRLIHNVLGYGMVTNEFTKSDLQLIQAEYQNIYITSNEEIKEGDWFYVKTSNIYGGNIVAKCLGFGENCWSEHILTDATDEKGYHPSHCVKIILTTDLELQKDSVQAIDDDFLEWFVKNPSCEKVLIIPKLFGHPYIIWIEGLSFKEEPKQETIEEAAEKASDREGFVDGALFGAKWQQERMYSEEEVSGLCMSAYNQGAKDGSKAWLGTFDKWFEQFKKK